jgi:hypothetical protein
MERGAMLCHVRVVERPLPIKKEENLDQENRDTLKKESPVCARSEGISDALGLNHIFVPQNYALRLSPPTLFSSSAPMVCNAIALPPLYYCSRTTNNTCI